MRTAVALVGAVTSLVLGSAGAAFAHGYLEGGSPGPGDEISPGSQVIRLDIAAIDPEAPVSIAMSDDDGTRVAVGEAQVVDGRHLCATTAPLTPAVWTVDYAGSGTDGHRIAGRYSFEVVGAGGTAADAGACASADLAAPADPGPSATGVDGVAGEDLDMPAWAFGGMGLLVVTTFAALVVRIRRDRALHDPVPASHEPVEG